MLQLDGALKEMERNGETQNRRSGSRVGVYDCWGRSSVKGSVKRIYSPQHSSKMTNTPNPNKNSRAGGIVHRDIPICSARRPRTSIPEKTPQADPHGWNPEPGRQTELGRRCVLCQCVVALHPDFCPISCPHAAAFLAHRRLHFSIRLNCKHMHPPSLDNASSPRTVPPNSLP
jgi:hypothetical protein